MTKVAACTTLAMANGEVAMAPAMEVIEPGPVAITSFQEFQQEDNQELQDIQERLSCLWKTFGR